MVDMTEVQERVFLGGRGLRERTTQRKKKVGLLNVALALDLPLLSVFVRGALALDTYIYSFSLIQHCLFGNGTSQSSLWAHTSTVLGIALFVWTPSVVLRQTSG